MRDILSLIRESLRALPLSEQEVANISAGILRASLLLQKLKPLDAGSTVFDFHSKLIAVADHFSSSGLSLDLYLKAAIKHPQLFCQAPETVISNIENTVTHFEDAGVTLSAYLRAAASQPQLFSLKSTRVQLNVEAVVNHFRDTGLGLSPYLSAAIRRPSLFTMSHERVISNIHAVADRFCNAGLLINDYLGAALKHPQLFYQLPPTIISNIEGVAKHFHDDGLLLDDYLVAAVKQPQLFTQAPSTIILHINMVINLHGKNLISFPKGQPTIAGRPLLPIFRFLTKNPAFLCLASDNYILREIYAHVAREYSPDWSLLKQSRSTIETKLVSILGNDDLTSPVSKELSPLEGGDKNLFARNKLLRALIREGLVKGSLGR